MDTALIQKAYENYQKLSSHYEDINKYYYGTTETLANFTPKVGRSNLKVNTNFIQKLVDEEAGYSFGNSISYVSLDANDTVASDIEYNMKNNPEDHDTNLGMELVKNGICYEISYLDKDKKFRNRKVSPLEGYMSTINGEPSFFIHVHVEEDEETYIDVYTDTEILHLTEDFTENEPPTQHYFGIVPVGYAIVGGIEYSTKRGYAEGDKTIYKAIKTLQDAFETNLSDMTNEISDFKNAILKIFNVTLKKEEDGTINAPIVRDDAVLFFGDKQTQDAEWLIKNINDTFIKNTRDDIKDLIYTLTAHIDNNEKMQSNLSGIALRSRLQMLENKCRLNEKAMTNIIKTRLKCLFKYLYQTQSKVYDVNLVKVQYTPNVPVDITSNADIVSKVPHDIASYKTLRTLFPFITDSEAEQAQIDKENENEYTGIDKDKVI